MPDVVKLKHFVTAAVPHGLPRLIDLDILVQYVVDFVALFCLDRFVSNIYIRSVDLL